MMCRDIAIMCRPWAPRTACFLDLIVRR